MFGYFNVCFYSSMKQVKSSVLQFINILILTDSDYEQEFGHLWTC